MHSIRGMTGRRFCWPCQAGRPRWSVADCASGRRAGSPGRTARSAGERRRVRLGAPQRKHPLRRRGHPRL